MEYVVYMLLLLPAAATATGRSDEPAPVLYFPAAFTAAECSSIARIFTEGASLEVDERSIPNLPRMADDYGVARLNRFDEGGRLQAVGALDWVYERVAAHLSPTMATRVLGGHGGGGERSSTAQRLGSLVEFSLMHEFDERHSRFDWCVRPPRASTRATRVLRPPRASTRAPRVLRPPRDHPGPVPHDAHTRLASAGTSTRSRATALAAPSTST